MKVIHGVGIFAAIALVASSVKYVGPGSIGVQTFLGRIQPNVLKPGVSFSLPLTWLTTFDTRQVSVPEKFGALTKDAQAITVTGTINYSISPSKAPDLYSQVGTTEEDVKNKVVQPILLGSVKRIVADHTMSEIIEKQSLISDQVNAMIVSSLKEAGFVNVDSFVVTGIILDPQVQAAIEEKQIALQNLERKSTEILAAQKEAERLNILTKSLTPTTLMDKAIEKWDGKGIPPTLSGGSIILNPGK